MSARRKLGENDPGRYEIHVLIGPCTLPEAELLLEDLDDAADDAYGACFSLTTWDEDESAALEDAEGKR